MKKTEIQLNNRLTLKENSFNEVMQELKQTYEFTDLKGRKVVLEIRNSNNESSKGKKWCLPEIWYKKGYTKEIIYNYLHVDSFVYDEKKGCYGLMYPMYKPAEDGTKRYVINFDWHLEDTPENRIKLLNEIIKCSDEKCKMEIEIEENN